MTEKSITVERSQREEGGQVWWWLHGDTYPHRELLKRHGARFSGKRKAWYWVGTELPAAIRALVAERTHVNEPQSNGVLNASLPVIPDMSPELVAMIEQVTQ